MNDRAIDSDVTADFAEVLAAASDLVIIDDAARAEAWMSSALSLWREHEDPAAVDLQFVSWLGQVQGDASLAVALAASNLGSPQVRAAMAGAAEELKAAGSTWPTWGAAVGTAEPTSAWRITDGADTSIGLGFVHADGGEHSVMADVSKGLLGSLVVGPPAADLFELLADDTTPETCEIPDAAREIAEAWEALLASDRPIVSEAYVVNHLLVESRLRTILGPDTERLAVVPVAEAAPVDDDIDESERRELNQWASDVLRRALTVDDDQAEPASADPSPAVVAAVQARGVTRQETQAFAELEWADWLGAVIGMHRAALGSAVDGRAMVDFVNQCPEVTSTIPKSDRPRMEAAFDAVVALLRDEGLLDADLTTTPHGLAALRAAVLEAWT